MNKLKINVAEELRRADPAPQWQASAAPQTTPSPEDDGEAELDLGKLFRALWGGKYWLILAMVVFGAIGYAYVTRMVTPLYTAVAKVALLETREDTLLQLDGVVSGLGTDSASINTELQIIQSREMMIDVVRALDLIRDPEFNGALRAPSARRTLMSPSGLIGLAQTRSWPEPALRVEDIEALPDERRAIVERATAAAVARAITVRLVPSTYILNIVVETQAPGKSAAIGNVLAQTYIASQLDAKFERTEQSTEWLSQRVVELQAELEAAEEAVKDFNASATLIDAGMLDQQNRQIKTLRDRIADLGARADTATARLAEFDAVANGSRRAQADVAGQPRLEALATRAERPSPDLLAAREFDIAFQDLRRSVDQDLRQSLEQRAALASTLARLETDVAQQSDDLVDLQQLQREADATRLIYNYFLTRLKETTVQQGIQQADSRVLSAAVPPLGASSPRRGLTIATMTMLGLLLASALLLAREFARSTFRTSEQLQAATGRPVLGIVPRVPGRRRKDILRYIIDKPTSFVAEAIRNLRTSLLLRSGPQGAQVVMVTSSIPGEGKTTQSLALAHNLIGLGKRVLLVEGDVRRMVFRQYFEAERAEGLVSVVEGRLALSDAVQAVEMLPGIDLLVGEETRRNAADLFSDEGFHRFLDEARERYDHIVIDTPPVLVVPDARIIAQLCDALIYVVRWDKTTRRQVREGIRSFRDANVDVSGVVLSAVETEKMRSYGYGDSYGAYGQYGKKYYTD